MKAETSFGPLMKSLKRAREKYHNLISHVGRQVRFENDQEFSPWIIVERDECRAVVRQADVELDASPLVFCLGSASIRLPGGTKTDLYKAVRRLATVIPESRGQGMDVCIDANGCVLTAVCYDAQGKEELDIRSKQPISFRIDSLYLKEALQVKLDSTLHYNGPLNPLVFDYGDHRLLVVPMNDR